MSLHHLMKRGYSNVACRKKARVIKPPMTACTLRFMYLAIDAYIALMDFAESVRERGGKDWNVHYGTPPSTHSVYGVHSMALYMM